MRTKVAVEKAGRLRWKGVYREVELYKAAVRVYTKPLFHWRKALNVSTDGNTLYELAARGLRGLEAVHNALVREEFRFRPSIGLKYNFNGKRRTLYIPPWEERIVDLVLYRALNRRLQRWFSPASYAYRDRTHGLDSCQSQIAERLRSSPYPLYLVKRDISEFFASIDHEILLRKLAELVEEDDYLFRLLQQRIRFEYQDETGTHRAKVGIAFGSASACVFANIYLTALDRAIEQIPDVHYFRYADDLLLLSSARERTLLAREHLCQSLNELKLGTKPTHQADLRLSAECGNDPIFETAEQFRHLGLLFQARGAVSLSRDKRRKIQNLFRFAFRRNKRRWKKITDPRERARTLAAIASATIEDGVRNVAIIDYYLKHVTAVSQLRLLDRWLAEEILSLTFGGHKKGHFAKLSFQALRELGLPSLVHRQKLIIHGHTKSPFFVWREQKTRRALRGTVASLVGTASETQASLRAQKQQLMTSVREGGCL
jgi:hypothetical protein